jgi:hypothetical protein
VLHERGRPGDLALINLQTWFVPSIGPCGRSTGKNRTEKEAQDIALEAHYAQTRADCLQGPLTPLVIEQPQGGALTQRLFSVVCVPFLILCSHVISTTFFIGYIRKSSHDDSHSSSSMLQKNLKRASMLVMLVYACSFFFLQSVWRLPGNNLLLCELWLICALFYISFHPASHFSEYERQKYAPKRYLEFAFTLPLLSVAAGASAGMTDVDSVNWLFFTSLFMCLFLLGVEYHHHSTTVLRMEWTEPAHMQTTGVLVLNALLCFVAFLISSIRAVDQALRIPQVAQYHLQWAPASLALVIVLHALYFLAVGVHRLLGLEHAPMHLFLDVLSLVGRGTVSLLILSGALDMQST